MIVISGGGGGDITAVVAGDGLSGGATDGSATLAVDLGTNPGLEFSSNKLQIAKGISQHDVPQFAASVADNDFLRVDGTTIEGRSASEVLSDIGGQASLTFGISNTNAVKVDSASVADDEYARFTANGLESRSTSEVLSDIGGAALTGSTDNTVATVTGANALAGEANLTFDGSTLAVTGAVTVSTDLTVSGGDIVYGNGQNATASVTATAHDAAGRNLTISAGSTTGGTSNNQAGGTLTFQGGQGKGSGAGGDIVFKTANADVSGSGLNSLATALTLSDDLSATFAGAVDLGSNTLTSTGSLQVRTIDYSDGDNAITIADGGGVTFPVSIDITGSTGIILENDETITNSTNGTISFSGGIAIPDTGNIGSASDLDAIAIAANGVVNFTQAPTVASAAIRTAGTEDMWIPAGSMRPTDTNGCATLTEVETTATRPDMQVLDFDSSTQEYAQFSVAMPKSWNEGTVTAQFYWTHATAVDTDVIWAIQGVCVSDNDTIDVAYGTAQTVTDTFHDTAEDLAITAATSAITLGGSPQAGDLAFFQVYRDADAGGDTTNSTDARLIGVKINYTTNAATDA